MKFLGTGNARSIVDAPRTAVLSRISAVKNNLRGPNMSSLSRLMPRFFSCFVAILFLPYLSPRAVIFPMSLHTRLLTASVLFLERIAIVMTAPAFTKVLGICLFGGCCQLSAQERTIRSLQSSDLHSSNNPRPTNYCFLGR